MRQAAKKISLITLSYTNYTLCLTSSVHANAYCSTRKYRKHKIDENGENKKETKNQCLMERWRSNRKMIQNKK